MSPRTQDWGLQNGDYKITMVLRTDKSYNAKLAYSSALLLFQCLAIWNNTGLDVEHINCPLETTRLRVLAKTRDYCHLPPKFPYPTP